MSPYFSELFWEVLWPVSRLIEYLRREDVKLDYGLRKWLEIQRGFFCNPSRLRRNGMRKTGGRTCKPDSPANVESKELLLNQEHRAVNNVSFGSVGRIRVTPASQFFSMRELRSQP